MYQLRFLLCLFFVVTAFTASARPVVGCAADSLPARAEDVRSADALLKALYDVISGPAGEQRHWDRMRTLFIPEGRLVSTGLGKDSAVRYRVMTVEDYIRLSGPHLVQNGFFEREIGRKTEAFGPIMHVFSTYESRHRLDEEKPFTRGINSIQLLNDGKRWWIVSVYWSSESAANPIPAKYLN